jgi:predicted metal-dependent phosphoesterase TrpH
MELFPILRRFLTFTIFSVLIIGSSLFAFVSIPSEKTYQNGDWNWQYLPSYAPELGNILFDPHSHTSISGGVLTPEQNLQYHLAMGYNSCVVTDKLGKKNGWDGSFEAQTIAQENYNDSIKVLIGIEYGSNRGHLNLIFPPNFTKSDISRIPYYGSLPSDDELKNFIEIIHTLGGIVILDHLIYSFAVMPTHPSLEKWLEWKIDYMEVVNGGDFDKITYDFCIANNIGMFGTTGMHVPQNTPVRGWTLVNSTEFTEDAIFKAIQNRNTSLIVQDYAAPYYSTHHPNYLYYSLKPLILLGSALSVYFPGGVYIDWGNFSIFIIYLIFTFIITEVIRIIPKRKPKNIEK